MSKKEWFPVHMPDSGLTTDYIVVEQDGTPVACYSDMGAAHYYSRLHNNFVSPIGILNEIDAMFQSEIDFRITAAWDAGIDWDCGHQLQGNEPTIEEALVAVINAAKKLYPDSEFARNRPYEMPLSVDLYEAEVLEDDED